MPSQTFTNHGVAVRCKPPQELGFLLGCRGAVGSLGRELRTRAHVERPEVAQAEGPRSWASGRFSDQLKAAERVVERCGCHPLAVQRAGHAGVSRASDPQPPSQNWSAAVSDRLPF